MRLSLALIIMAISDDLVTVSDEIKTDTVLYSGGISQLIVYFIAFKRVTRDGIIDGKASRFKEHGSFHENGSNIK